MGVNGHLYTSAEVADLWQVSKRTIYRFVQSGELRPVYLGDLPRFTSEELERFLETKRAPVQS